MESGKLLIIAHNMLYWPQNVPVINMCFNDIVCFQKIEDTSPDSNTLQAA